MGLRDLAAAPDPHACAAEARAGRARRGGSPRRRPAEGPRRRARVRASCPTAAASSKHATATAVLARARRRARPSRARRRRGVPPTPSACAMPTFVRTATSGSTMRASAAISPRTLMPTSKTAKRWCGSRPKATAGTPMRLFRLPAVAWHGPTACSSAAQSSFVVVLPALPVIANDAARRRARDATRARAPGRDRPRRRACRRPRPRRPAPRRRAAARPFSTTTSIGAAADGGLQVVVPVVALAAQRDERASPASTARLSLAIAARRGAVAAHLRRRGPPSPRRRTTRSAARRSSGIGVAMSGASLRAPDARARGAPRSGRRTGASTMPTI